MTAVDPNPRIIRGDTQLAMSLKELIGVGIVTVATAWGAVAWSNSGLRTDVSSIRGTIEKLQGSDKDNAVNLKQAEVDLGKEIGDLRVTMVSFGDKVTAVGDKFDTVNKSMVDLSAQLADMKKQVAFRPASFDTDKIQQIVKESGGKVILLAPEPGVEVPPK